MHVFSILKYVYITLKRLLVFISKSALLTFDAYANIRYIDTF